MFVVAFRLTRLKLENLLDYTLLDHCLRITVFYFYWNTCIHNLCQNKLTINFPNFGV